MLKLPRPLLSPLLQRSLVPLAIAFTSGLCMGFAPAPLNWWGLAWVTLAPLWVLSLESKTDRSALFYALVWGIGYHGLALAWITGLHPLTWMGIPWAASLAITGFCWGFITLWGAVLVILWVWALRQLGQRCFASPDLTPSPRRAIADSVQRVIVAIALWCLLEQIWSWGALYWTALAYTQSPGNLVILHLGQLSGPALVTAAIVAVNGLLAEAWIARGEGLRSAARELSAHPHRLSGSGSLCTIACGLFCSLHLIGYSLYNRPLPQPPDMALRVGMIQGNVPTRIKLSAAGIQRAVAGYVSGYEQLTDQGAQAVLTPEGAMPIVWNERTRELSPFFRAVAAKGQVAWLGTFVPQADGITQSLLTLTPAGSSSRYSKIKLVPLGEYLPFQRWLGGLIGRLSPLKWSMIPGTSAQRFDTPFGRAIVSICYESAFSELFRAQAADGGQFILTAANLDPYSEVLMAQHQAQDVMRAIELDRWAARATNTGYSGILDPHGQVVWRSQPRTYATHIETIYRRQTQTLYVRYGDWLTPLLGVIGIISSRRWLKRQR